MTSLGTSVSTLKRLLESARTGAVFFIVSPSDDDTTEQVTSVLLDVPPLLAERSHILAIETVL